jgi:hypothetical protein
VESGGGAAGMGESYGAAGWETTRYLSAATQRDLKYAQLVVRRLIGEPFRAIAPTAGADVVVVARWALAALRRRAQRDAVLTCVLCLGVVAAVLAWSWLPILIMLVFAAIVGGRERWLVHHGVVARQMLRDRFDPASAPSFRSKTVERRLSMLERQQGGNLIVFQGQQAFVGSGRRVRYNRIVINVHAGKRGKDGKVRTPIPFTNRELHDAIVDALDHMGFPGLRVEERLYVSGQHLADKPQLLPNDLAPPVASVGRELLDQGAMYPTPDARTYVCAEVGGWKGQLVVSMFVRAVQARGSLHVDWTFRVLPPLNSIFLMLDTLYDLPKARQLVNTAAASIILVIPALLLAPAQIIRYSVRPLIDQSRRKGQSYKIEHGLVFDYGSLDSIRESASGYNRLHYFLAQDEWTYILLAEHTLLRVLGTFLDAHKVDLEHFKSQENTFIKNVNKTKFQDFTAENIAAGKNARAGSRKPKGGDSD